MKKLRENAAAFDLGSKSIFLATEDEQVRSFGTFTEDFCAARDYLKSLGIQTVAMEATGVYWFALYDILSDAGIDVWLVDGRQTKQVPGRKTDVKDCQWILQLHIHGLLSRCFIPEKHMQEIRSYQRLREDHIRSAAMHINHMQKALIEMNIRLPEVLSQIHGKTGQALIKAILEGERNPVTLLSLCHISVQKTKADQILKALNGHYTSSGLFALRQAFNAYHFYQDQIAECDGQLNQSLKRINKYDQDDQVKKKLNRS